MTEDAAALEVTVVAQPESVEDIVAKWKASVAGKKAGWLVAKYAAGIYAAPLLLEQLHMLGLTFDPGSVLAVIVPKYLPAVLAVVLHVAQDAAAIKTGAKWL